MEGRLPVLGAYPVGDLFNGDILVDGVTRYGRMLDGDTIAEVEPQKVSGERVSVFHHMKFESFDLEPLRTVDRGQPFAYVERFRVV